ncbi:MAG: hypothetical protein ABJ084_00905 [Halioglobus sp.]
MEFWLLIVAALLSLFGTFFHGVIGGKIYISNINNSNLDTLGKSLSLVSWHMFTIFLFIGAAAFSLVAFNQVSEIVTYPLIIINAMGALMFLLLAFGSHKHLKKMPGAYLMGATALCGYLGVALTP